MCGVSSRTLSKARAADVAVTGHRLAASRPFGASATEREPRGRRYPPASDGGVNNGHAHGKPTANHTGMPTRLKEGIETLSGLSLDDVRVHRASSKPAALHASAYTQGSDIYLSSGAERHLPHEAWHVVQQKQGRVRANVRPRGVSVSTDGQLEREADTLGARALTTPPSRRSPEGGRWTTQLKPNPVTAGGVVQRVGEEKFLVIADKAAPPEDVAALTESLRLFKQGHRRAKKYLLGETRTYLKATRRAYEAEEALALKDPDRASGGSKLAVAIHRHNKDAQKQVMNIYGRDLRGLPINKWLEADGYVIENRHVKSNNTTIAMLVPLDEGLVSAGEPSRGDADRDPGEHSMEGTDGARQTPREILKKDPRQILGGSGEYVRDTRGVPTRRFAYVEKNFYQMMDLLESGVITGRYQSMVAATLGQSVKSVATETSARRPPGAKLRSDFSTRTDADLSLAELAVFHQWQGSSLQQRGVSLTSTPTPHAVWSNEGWSFRSRGGVRLKVDLARVPTDVILINHYDQAALSRTREGGIANRVLGEWEQTDRAKYHYPFSVTKNREVYLDHLDPDWVVECRYHRSGDDEDDELVWPMSGGSLLDALARAMGGDAYREGVRRGKVSFKADDLNTWPSRQMDLARRRTAIGRGLQSGQWWAEGAHRANREMRCFQDCLESKGRSPVPVPSAGKRASKRERVPAAIDSGAKAAPKGPRRRTSEKANESKQSDVAMPMVGGKAEEESQPDAAPTEAKPRGSSAVPGGTVKLVTGSKMNPKDAEAIVLGSDVTLLCQRAVKMVSATPTLFDTVQALNSVMTDARKALGLDPLPDAYWRGWVDRVSPAT